MKLLLLPMLLSLALSTGCGDDKKKSPAAAAEPACSSNEDCDKGWVCLDSVCADPGPGAIYSDPGNAVTPDKVKREVEKIGREREQRHDKLLDGL